jgi:hypothetical protein
MDNLFIFIMFHLKPEFIIKEIPYLYCSFREGHFVVYLFRYFFSSIYQNRRFRMPSCIKSEGKLSIFQNEVIHSLYKGPSSHASSLSVEPHLSVIRHVSEASILKKTSPVNDKFIKYSSYPSIFKNKTSNIRRILNKRKGSDNFERVINQQKKNKFNLILQDNFKNEEHFNY